jgi:hypothetical protein
MEICKDESCETKKRIVCSLLPSSNFERHTEHQLSTLGENGMKCPTTLERKISPTPCKHHTLELGSTSAPKAFFFFGRAHFGSDSGYSARGSKLEKPENVASLGSSLFHE